MATTAPAAMSGRPRQPLGLRLARRPLVAAALGHIDGVVRSGGGRLVLHDFHVGGPRSTRSAILCSTFLGRGGARAKWPVCRAVLYESSRVPVNVIKGIDDHSPFVVIPDAASGAPTRPSHASSRCSAAQFHADLVGVERLEFAGEHGRAERAVVACGEERLALCLDDLEAQRAAQLAVRHRVPLPRRDILRPRSASPCSRTTSSATPRSIPRSSVCSAFAASRSMLAGLTSRTTNGRVPPWMMSEAAATRNAMKTTSDRSGVFCGQRLRGRERDRAAHAGPHDDGALAPAERLGREVVDVGDLAADAGLEAAAATRPRAPSGRVRPFPGAATASA